MILKDTNYSKRDDYQAYSNLRNLRNKNIDYFDDLSDEERKLQLNFIYDLFANFADKGFEYKDSRFNPYYGVELHKQKSIKASTDICIFSIVPNYISAKIKPAYYDDIVIEKSSDKVILSANLALSSNLKTVIYGEQKPDSKSQISIVTADYNYEITGASLFSLFGELKDCVVSQNELEELSTSTNYSRYALQEFMKTRYPFLDDLQLQRFINKNVKSGSSFGYYQSMLSNYAIEKYLLNYVKEVEKGYIEGTTLKKEPIVGLELDEAAIKKFVDYEVTDIFGQKNKLIDIAVYMQDYDNDSYSCPFLEALETIPKKDIDVFIVGLCYFATYCTELGRVDAHNRYGRTPAKRLSGEKLNIAIKSSLLGVKVADYAEVRETSDETDFIMRCFFNEMGFDNIVNLDKKPNVSVDKFEDIMYPYLRGRRNFYKRRY